MASKVISFRLSDSEIEILESLRSPSDEQSLNVTAARLLRNILGTSTQENKPVDSIGIQEIIKREIKNLSTEDTKTEAVDSIVIKSLVSQEVQKAITELICQTKESTGSLITTDTEKDIGDRLTKLEESRDKIEGFEADFNVWVDDLKDVSMLSSQVKHLSSRVENVEKSLNDWVLRLCEMMNYWDSKMQQVVDKLRARLVRYYGDIKEDTLIKLKVGKQSSHSKSIDEFIKQLEKYGEE
ncbi:hypothetical protein WJM97_21915 [Okeanomitos corallinicola TIOX110]|uniref:Uncharacterized protein n=1 Tax=Okeanomitos corallinicola TIOX110 TaxID=3133117 RepID=A0ABZ2USM8_9CYAN